MIDRRTFLKGAALSSFLAAPAPLRAAFRQDPPPFEEVTAEQQAAVKRGLEYLARSQTRSGSLGPQAPLAFTSLAGLAWMAGGSTPTRGPYATNVMNALKYVMRCSSRPTGYINEGATRGAGGSGMHGHGYALLFLSELYGMCGEVSDSLGDDSVKEAITKAVGVTERAQHSSGGWTYDPKPEGHEGSVTVTQVQALRSARNIGVNVSEKKILLGISYIRKSTAADGTIMYSLGQGAHSTYPLTAAGACVYAYFGLYDDPQGQKCMKALFDFVMGKRASQYAHFEYYAIFYAAQACFFMKRKEP
ncbi:MAG TPA: hypothetical protein VGK61_07085, partial [Planctomycetota bacterium]